MTEQRKKLIDKFQAFLDTKPREQIIAAECANIAEEYHALQLLQTDVISSVKPEWLKKDIIDSVKNLWNLPNNDNSNPRTSAIKLVRKQAKHYGYKIDLKKAVEIVKEHCL